MYYIFKQITNYLNFKQKNPDTFWIFFLNKYVYKLCTIHYTFELSFISKACSEVRELQFVQLCINYTYIIIYFLYLVKFYFNNLYLHKYLSGLNTDCKYWK